VKEAIRREWDRIPKEVRAARQQRAMADIQSGKVAVDGARGPTKAA
jgi:hypothetical protein